MVPFKITDEDKERILSIGLDSSFKSVLKLMHNLVIEQYDRLIQVSVEDGEDKLVQLKCRADGSQKLFLDLKRFIEKSGGRVTDHKKKIR